MMSAMRKGAGRWLNQFTARERWLLVLGGVGSLTGAMGGALLTIALEEGLARFSEHWRLGFGLILVAVALFSPGGLSGLLRRLNLTRLPK